MNPILVDIIIAAVVLLCVWSGYRKGFVLTLCGFLAVFVAFLGAAFLSNLLAGPVATAITPVVEETVQQLLEEHVNFDLPELPDGSFSLPEGVELPDGIQLPEGIDLSDGLDLSELPISAIPLDEITAALQDSPILQRLAQSFRSAVDSGVIDATASISGALASFLAREIARIVLFVLAFILILIGWFILSHALDLAFKLPVLSTLNAWAGAAVGLLKALVLVGIALWLLKDNFIPTEVLEGSLILAAVHNFTANYS